MRWRSTRTAVPPGQSAGRLSRRRGGRAPACARECGERAFGRVGDGQPRVAARGPDRRVSRRGSPRPAGPPLPQRRRSRHPRSGGTTAGAIAAAWWNRCAANLFRDRRATPRIGARRSGCVRSRTSARVVLLDDSGAVLLLCGSDPANPAFRDGAAPKWWFTVGGQVRPGERLAQAAARELAEETGLRVAPADMIGPIWRRDEVFEFNGSLIDSEEFYLVHRTRRFEPAVQGRTSWNAAIFAMPAGVTRTTSRSWWRRASGCTRCN